jgi:protein O-mannosyl-transferase
LAFRKVLMKTLKIYPAIFLVFSLTFLIYFPAIDGDFIWDDDVYVSENEQLKNKEGLKNIWLKPGATAQYYPLVFTTFWVEYRLWGEDPAGYHIINIVLHASSALILWRLLILLSIPGAGLASLIFLMHPVNVESVAWITERKNMLSGLFYLSSLSFYLRFLQMEISPSRKNVPRINNELFYVLSFISFLLAMFSKTVTCTLPAVILLIIWWKKDSINLKDILRVTPFLISVLILIPITLATEKLAGTKGPDWDFSFAERFIIAGKALWFYLYKLILPLNLTFSYPKWSIDATLASNYLPSLGYLALIGGLGFLCNKLGKAPLVAILFFAGTLFPALGFFSVYPMRYSFAADHFQYLACIGPIALFASSLTKLATSDAWSRNKPYLMPAISVTLLCILGFLTWKQTHIYENREVLWKDTLSKNPGSGMAHTNLGKQLEERGEEEKAFDHYRKALALNPNFFEIHHNLGNIYHKKGELDLAVSEFKRSLELNPAYYSTYNGLASVLAEQGKLEQALFYARECVRMQPDYIAGMVTLANILEELGELNEAQAYYEQALILDSNSFENHLNLANVLYKRGNLKEAAPHFKKAIALNPELVEAYYNLGNIFGQQGQLGEAQKAFEKAISLNEKLPLPHYGLGIIHQRSGKNSQAIEAFNKALSLNPELEQAHLFLARLYDEMGEEQKSIFHIRAAEKISEKNQARMR